MHVYLLGVQPCLNYWAHAIDLSTTELRALDTTHSNLIKWLLGLSKFCRSTPLLQALGVQRIPAMRDHQSVNLLKRCLAGSPAASTFYRALIHNRDTDVTRTIVNKLNLVGNSIFRVWEQGDSSVFVLSRTGHFEYSPVHNSVNINGRNFILHLHGSCHMCVSMCDQHFL